MAEFPLDPQLSKMIVAAPEFKCSNEILRWGAAPSSSAWLGACWAAARSGWEARARAGRPAAAAVCRPPGLGAMP